MKTPSNIRCADRRSGIERRRYSYDSHVPDRRRTRQHRSGVDRREDQWPAPSRSIDDNTPEH